MPRPKRNLLADVQAASDPPAELPTHHFIAQVIKGEGNNIFSVTDPFGDELLVELASKLVKSFWIKRGGFVIINPDALAERDNKLSGEIVVVLRNEKAWRKMSYWPKAFPKKEVPEASDDDEDEDEEESRVGQMPPSDSEDE